MTEAKVSLAAAEEKRAAIEAAVAELRERRDQSARDLATERSQLDLDRRRRSEAEESIRQAEAEVDRLFQRQQQLDTESEELEESRRGLQAKLEDIRRELGAKRKQHDEAADRLNALRVELGEADVRIETLISRASEEMQMDLPEQYRTYEHDEARDWQAVEAEVQELRGKLERLGNVNLDAIAEQDELEQRREFLSGQIEDVEASRRQLTDLIRRINRQSRELFSQTFAAVRENFQSLFRKLFGGGRADLLLLEPEDILESPIEIVARPPGKETRALSLLSGGEKTLTALSLMFSFFRARPSPFCLLDEVDAALDEANTERFNRLIGEFIADSQFVIITHAKRTMSTADVLYGVTMQEAGVSKRISVRFEEAGRALDEQLEPVEA
jgi:chromosome segregation protein